MKILGEKRPIVRFTCSYCYWQVGMRGATKIIPYQEVTGEIWVEIHRGSVIVCRIPCTNCIIEYVVEDEGGISE